MNYRHSRLRFLALPMVGLIAGCVNTWPGTPQNCNTDVSHNQLIIGNGAIQVMNGCQQTIATYPTIHTPRADRKFIFPPGVIVTGTDCTDPFGRPLGGMGDNCIPTNVFAAGDTPHVGYRHNDTEQLAFHTAAVYKNPESVNANAGCPVLAPKDLAALKKQVVPGMKITGQNF
jgi:hypothetical protein